MLFLGVSQCWFRRLGTGLIVVLSVNCLAENRLMHPSEEWRQQVQEEYGKHAGQRLGHWNRLLREGRNLNELDKLTLVNQFFNKIPQRSDLESWGVDDYWATPAELLASNGGDCEDYALAKYFTLLGLEVSDERLRLTYVKATQLKQAHMVLLYYPDLNHEPLVLDSTTSVIKPASKRNDLKPVYSFKGKGLWLSRARGRGQINGKPEDLNH